MHADNKRNIYPLTALRPTWVKAEELKNALLSHKREEISPGLLQQRPGQNYFLQSQIHDDYPSQDSNSSPGKEDLEQREFHNGSYLSTTQDV